MKRYIKATDSDFRTLMQDELDYVNSLKYDSKLMKCSKTHFSNYINWWLQDIIDSINEDDLSYHKEFYLSQIYKKKYNPFYTWR